MELCMVPGFVLLHTTQTVSQTSQQCSISCCQQFMPPCPTVGISLCQKQWDLSRVWGMSELHHLDGKGSSFSLIMGRDFISWFHPRSPCNKAKTFCCGLPACRVFQRNSMFRLRWGNHHGPLWTSKKHLQGLDSLPCLSPADLPAGPSCSSSSQTSAFPGQHLQLAPLECGLHGPTGQGRAVEMWH